MSQNDINFMPESVWKHFSAITKVSHPSANQEGVTGNEDPVREYVIEAADQIADVQVVFYDKSATEPGQRVIVLQRLGTGDYATASPIILQGHMDMVFNPVDMEFPLNVIESPGPQGGKWLKAKDQRQRDCTLGADDGIGVATALAILEDESLKEYPIECLFTVQEETNMGGAQGCDLHYLKGDKLLNLDAESLRTIIFGSAGGNETSYCRTVLSKELPQGYKLLHLSISGLQGGHSGIDINKGRLNAIKALGEVLFRLNSRLTQVGESADGLVGADFLLCRMNRTDIEKANAIPAAAEAIIALPEDALSRFSKDFHTYSQTLQIQNQPTEPGFTAEAKEYEDTALTCLDKPETNRFLCMLRQLLHGVISMIPEVPMVVQTSTNLYKVRVADSISIASSNRSSKTENLASLMDIQKNIAEGHGFAEETGINGYPMWQPDESSALLKKAKSVYQGLYDDAYQATVIHAGLECGVLVERFQNELNRKLEAVSIGPTITNPHTPMESLQVEDGPGHTVVQFNTAVKKLIKAAFAS